jgi:hypothetical protein
MPRTKQTHPISEKPTSVSDKALAKAKGLTKPSASRKAPGLTEEAKATKKQRKFSNITLATRRIRKAQKNSAEARAFARAPLTRVVRSMVADRVIDARISKKAVLALEALTKDWFIHRSQEALRTRVCALTPGQSAKRTNITTASKHLRLAYSNWATANGVPGIEDHIHLYRQQLGHDAYARS